ncbi:MAG: ABC transporter substrate-binding protein [Saezia sp.]
MLKPSYVIKTLAASLATLAMLSPGAWSQQKSVAVTAITDHPSLEAVRDGIQETLANAGYVDGKNLRWQYQSAQGNTSIAAQIARKFVGDRPDVIVAISTPSAQTMVAATKTTQTPVIFTAVTDPVSSKLTSSWEASGTNITGVSDKLDLERQVDLILRIVPDAKRIGIVYNTAEVNSDAVVKSFQEIFAKRGLTLYTAAAPRTVDVGGAALSLVGKIDVFYATTDNNVVSAMEALIKVGQDAKIPVIASDPLSVERGAIAALGVDYKELGRQAGAIILRIFNGEKPGDIAPQTLENLQLYLNPKAAERQGVTLPADLIKEATVIVD